MLQEIHPDGRYTYIYTDPDSYDPLAQVHNRTNEDGESHQQTHYFHYDQIGIPREMTDKDGNLLWYGEYTSWVRLKKDEFFIRTHIPRGPYKKFISRITITSINTKNRFIFFLLLRILIPLKLELLTSLMTYLILIKGI